MLSVEEQLKLVRAEKKALLEEFFRQTDLLSYYRALVPDNGTHHLPPPNYWLKPGTVVLYGFIVEGCLKPIGKVEDEKTAVQLCWGHFETMKQKASVVEEKVRISREQHGVETSPTRRRRRVADD